MDIPGAGTQAFLKDPGSNLIELNQPSAPLSRRRGTGQRPMTARTCGLNERLMGVGSRHDHRRAPVPIDVCDPRFFDSPWDGYRWLRQEARSTGTTRTSCGWSAATRTWSPSPTSGTARARACARSTPRRCRSSPWTIPSTPASAGWFRRASRRSGSAAQRPHPGPGQPVHRRDPVRGAGRLRPRVRHPRPDHRDRRAAGARSRDAPASLQVVEDMMGGDVHRPRAPGAAGGRPSVRGVHGAGAAAHRGAPRASGGRHHLGAHPGVRQRRALP